MNFKKLEECINMIIEKFNVPGADCMVYKDHEPIFRYFAGMSDRENNIKMNGEELYLIFSMTKMITCTAALQLFEQGKFDLDDPISKYLPEFAKMKISETAENPQDADKITRGEALGHQSVESKETGYAENPITIRHLFTMSAGFDYILNAPYIQNALEAGKSSTRELVASLAETVLGFEPGTKFKYSLCHDVLGGLIEVISGRSLGEYMEENIFAPLGMKNTFFGLPKDDRISKMAALYFNDGNGACKRKNLECPYNLSNEYQSGGAGLTSSTEDYALFLDAIACGGVGKTGKRILMPQTMELMSSDQCNEQMHEGISTIKPGYTYGLGVRVHEDQAKSQSPSPLGEFGWDGAAGALSMVDPERRLSLTYFQHVHAWNAQVHLEIKKALYSCLD